MNKTIQFLNKSVLLSICLHLIGVGIAALSIVGTADRYGDSIVAEFVSFPKLQKTLHTPRRLKIPDFIQPEMLPSHPPRLAVRTEVAHVQQKALQFVVDTLPISTVDETGPVEIGIADERVLQHRFASSQSDSGLHPQPAHFTPKRMSRPEWTSTSLAIASTQDTELPAVSVFPNEPIQNATFFRKVDPIYPESARLSHKQGLVVLEATIGVDGIARNIKVVKVVEVSGLGCEEAAVTALKASQFVPAKQGKVAVSQRLRIPYRFQFKS